MDVLQPVQQLTYLTWLITPLGLLQDFPAIVAGDVFRGIFCLPENSVAVIAFLSLLAESITWTCEN